MPEYPYVECGKPGHPLEPGYAVCIHVLSGAEAVEVEPASPEALGRIQCGECPAETVDDFVLVCATCARERGWIDA